jgi:hypothetical protein
LRSANAATFLAWFNIGSSLVLPRTGVEFECSVVGRDAFALVMANAVFHCQCARLQCVRCYCCCCYNHYCRNARTNLQQSRTFFAIQLTQTIIGGNNKVVLISWMNTEAVQNSRIMCDGFRLSEAALQR